MSIRVLIAVPGRLSAAALAALLGQEDGLEVVADCGEEQHLLSIAAECTADVILLDTELGAPAPSALIATLRTGAPHSRVLALVHSRHTARLCRTIPQAATRIGFVSADATATTLLEGIRRVAAGEPFVDSPLALAALTASSSPLTERERDVLLVAAEGLRVRDIADRLFLAQGTVRNHLSRIIGKTGAQSRIQAIRIAEEAGWL